MWCRLGWWPRAGKQHTFGSIGICICCITRIRYSAHIYFHNMEDKMKSKHDGNPNLNNIYDNKKNM